MFLRRSVTPRNFLVLERGPLIDREQGTNDVILTGLDAHAPEGAVKRRLKARHISMVSNVYTTGMF